MSEYNRRSNVSVNMDSDEEVTSRKEQFPIGKRESVLIHYVSDTDESKDGVEKQEIVDDIVYNFLFFKFGTAFFLAFLRIPSHEYYIDVIFMGRNSLSTGNQPIEKRTSVDLNPPTRKKRRNIMSSIFRKSTDKKRKEESCSKLKSDVNEEDH
ncbi:hypothetical protein ACFE04_001036 [Oxalis oulophora]